PRIRRGSSFSVESWGAALEVKSRAAGEDRLHLILAGVRVVMHPEVKARPVVADSKSQHAISQVIARAGGNDVSDALLGFRIVSPGKIRFEARASYVSRGVDPARGESRVRVVHVRAGKERYVRKDFEGHDHARQERGDPEIRIGARDVGVVVGFPA